MRGQILPPMNVHDWNWTGCAWKCTACGHKTSKRHDGGCWR